MIVIISIDRCMAIMDPMSKNRGPRRVKVMIGVAWLLSVVLSLPQVRETPTSIGCTAIDFNASTNLV